MPNLSASDYTTYLKFQAAAQTPIRPGIQTRDNVTLSPSVLNAMTLTSQAAYVVNPYNLRTATLATTVSAASSTTVSAARTDIITSATSSGTTLLTYTTSQSHGLVTGTSITITGLTQNTLPVTPNRTGNIVVTGTTTFTIDTGSTVAVGTSSGTGSITGLVYYTTTVANGLVAGDKVSITGITTFTASGATVFAGPSATTFALLSSTTGTAVSAQTGTIVGAVYYTTAAAHGLPQPPSVTLGLTITGLTTTLAFNVSSAALFKVPSTTVFALITTATGTAITGQTGVITLITTTNRNNTLTGLARVVARNVPQTRSNPDKLSTVGWMSGSSGSVGSYTSSALNVPGGLPAKNRVGTYSRVSHIALPEIHATGAYMPTVSTNVARIPNLRA